MSDARTAIPDPLDALSTTTREVARGSDLDAALTSLLGGVIGAVGALRGAIAVQDPDRPFLELVTSVGMDDAVLALARDSLRDPSHPIHETVRSRRPAWDRPGTADRSVVHADLPLVVTRDGADRVLGVLAIVWQAPYTADGRVRTVLSTAADLAAIAIDRTHLASLVTERAEWFERVAHSDPLTGLTNQRTFARVLELELARAGRQAGEVSLLVVHVDGFDAINERAGHEVGDDVLRSVAVALAESVRLVDTVARLSGAEFVVVAPGPSGMTIARRIAGAVAALPGGHAGPLSVSIGVARFPADATSADELLASARRSCEAAEASGSGIANGTGRPTG